MKIKSSKYTNKCIFVSFYISIYLCTLQHGCSPIILLHISRTPFLKNTSGWLLLNILISLFILEILSPTSFQQCSSFCLNYCCDITMKGFVRIIHKRHDHTNVNITFSDAEKKLSAVGLLGDLVEIFFNKLNMIFKPLMSGVY